MKLPVYLDNNATCPIDPEVLAAMLPVLKEHFGNPASSTHSYGWYANELVEIAREQVAELVGAKPYEIIFTSGATESNNSAIKGFVEHRRKADEGQQITLVSCLTEHKSVLEPLNSQLRKGCIVKLLPVNKNGIILKDFANEIFSEQISLVSLMLVNNETGVIQNIRTFVDLCRNNGVIFHCDAAQGLGKIPINVATLGVDLLSLSAHKIYGPKGIGALYIKSGISKPSALIEGGGHELGIRAGTLNTPAIVGFGKACEIAKIRLADDLRKLEELNAIFCNQLMTIINDCEINCSQAPRIPGCLNITIPQVNSSRLIAQISSKVAISAASACQSASDKPSHVLEALGLPKDKQLSSFRIGIGRFNTKEDVAFAAQVIGEAAIKLRTR